MDRYHVADKSRHPRPAGTQWPVSRARARVRARVRVRVIRVIRVKVRARVGVTCDAPLRSSTPAARMRGAPG
jgi:hypothetical protein